VTSLGVASLEGQPGSQSRSSANTDLRRLQVMFWSMLIATTVVRAWFTRYEFDADSVSYLDIARSIAEGHCGAVVNAYWSPGYPILLSVFLWLFRPNAFWECPLAHFANVCIFVGTLASFQLFWKEAWMLHKNHAGQGNVPIPEAAFWILGYSMFAVATLNLAPVSRVGPDLLVAGFCCIAGWCVFRFRRAPGYMRALTLGMVLALGYYAKAPFFPIGLVIILSACAMRPASGRTVLLWGTALSAFLLACSPFAAALSIAQGRLTFGDSARLAHAFYIDGVQHYQHWQGGPAGAGIAIHPTRQLNDFPEVYEFAAKNMGTYPPWFDPIYWNAGITPHFRWKMQVKVLASNMLLELQLIVESCAALVCAVIILAFVCNHRRRWTTRFLNFWFLWLPGAAAFLMFALIHVEARFFGGWLIMLLTSAICASALPNEAGAERVAGYIAMAALVIAVASVVSQVSQEALGPEHAAARNPRNALIATFLLDHSLRPGDLVAVIGYANEAYWAHLARLTIVAEVPARITSHQSYPALDFWESGREQQQKALAIIEQTGAKAVIAGSQMSALGSAPSVLPQSWKKIDGTDACVYFFSDQPISAFNQVDKRN
jgi:hypothetical protein